MAGSVKVNTNFMKINYILNHVLLVGKWNEKRKKIYMAHAKKYRKSHLIVVFKNQNGHDCLGKYSIVVINRIIQIRKIRSGVNKDT